MPIRKHIVCLANSRKLGGRCIAGKECRDNGPRGWIRPVSDRPSEEVSRHERQYENGSDPQVLDIIDIPVTCHKPKYHQQENWLLDTDYHWSKSGVILQKELVRFVDPVRSLWINGYNTLYGRNDEIPIDKARSLDSSLSLIHVDDLSLVVSTPGEAFGNPTPQVRGRFSYREEEYALRITDPLCEKEYLSRMGGPYEIGEAFLTISLGELFPERNACYKLIAAVIQPNKANGT